MDINQSLGQPVGKVTTTYNGEKVQVNVYADRSVVLPDGTIRKKDDGTMVWGTAELIIYTSLGDDYNVRVACFNRS